jgi:hypothetical protein
MTSEIWGVFILDKWGVVKKILFCWVKVRELNPPILGDFEFYFPPELGARGQLFILPQIPTLGGKSVGKRLRINDMHY